MNHWLRERERMVHSGIAFQIERNTVSTGLKLVWCGLNEVTHSKRFLDSRRTVVDSLWGQNSKSITQFLTLQITTGSLRSIRNAASTVNWSWSAGLIDWYHTHNSDGGLTDSSPFPCYSPRGVITQWHFIDKNASEQPLEHHWTDRGAKRDRTLCGS